MTHPNPSAILASLERHPHAAALAARVRDLALEAARETNPAPFGPEAAVTALPDAPPELETRTELGDLDTVLRAGPESAEDRLLLSGLLALGLRASPPAEGELQQLGVALAWLAANTPFDALSFLDTALGPSATPLWSVLGELAVQPVGMGGCPGRATALAAAGALRGSSSAAAQTALRDAAARATDPLVRSLLVDPTVAGRSELVGELEPPPRPTWRFVLLAITGMLLVLHVGRLIGRFALGYRHPARFSVTGRGLELTARSELLGRTLRDRQAVVPLDSLVRVTREVRYSRASLYAGLGALVLGSYIGMGWLVDGVRVPGGSPPLLGMGLLIILLGLAIDFGLSTLADTVRGRCRVVIVPQRGRPLAVGGLEPAQADAMLTQVAALAARGPHAPSPVGSSAS